MMGLLVVGFGENLIFDFEYIRPYLISLIRIEAPEQQSSSSSDIIFLEKLGKTHAFALH